MGRVLKALDGTKLPVWAIEALEDLHAIRVELEKLNRHFGA